MKKNNKFTKVLLVLFAAIFVLACNAIVGGGADAPAQTNPSLPTDQSQPVAPINTSAPAPTQPPQPTATAIVLDTPTPASVGEAVRSDSYEVTVLDAKEIRRVYMGDHYFYPETGHTFVEVIVKVSNLTGSKASVPWENVYVVEDSGDSFYPYWGGFKAVNTGKKVDGSTVGVNEIVDSKAVLEFEEDVFLRLIWYITKNDPTTILFEFDNSPQIEITID
jgi:hypothetical protein